MNYEYRWNAEHDKIVNILINGKPIKAGFLRGWKKAQETPYWKIVTDNYTAENPFSGVTVELNPLEATIYTFLMRWYRRYERSQETFAPIQTYDDMKYFLCDINSQAYMDLID